jgi:hypothetical protein
MDATPEVKAVQDEYLRLATSSGGGSDPLPAMPMKDRDIFDLLGIRLMDHSSYHRAPRRDRSTTSTAPPPRPGSVLTSNAPVGRIRATVRAGARPHARARCCPRCPRTWTVCACWIAGCGTGALALKPRGAARMWWPSTSRPRWWMLARQRHIKELHQTRTGRARWHTLNFGAGDMLADSLGKLRPRGVHGFADPLRHTSTSSEP